ncbi:MAG: hypothetical protein Q8M94_20195, partial [Ignavibacteria bacterium]|nr:hypothetical protein [Ignavibacteria bacterium]
KEVENMSTSQITKKVLMNAVTISAATKYSDSMPFRQCAGSAILLIISTAGTLAISQQCSNDNVNWYNPVDTAGGALGVVKAAQTVTPGVYVVFTPVLSEWVRFKVIESTAETVVTLTLSYRLEV